MAEGLWAMFLLFTPVVISLAGLAAWEAISQFRQDAQHNKQRVRELHRQNHELRDEIARLTRHR